jgi:thiosulfate/3-mercaptopyruvate sulfurtransferase
MLRAGLIGHVLDGGFCWRSLGLPVDGLMPAIRPAISSLTSSRSRRRRGVVLVAADGGCRLLDAHPSFRGEIEPLDTVAGHVPGALNHPLTESLAADGRLREPEELRRSFEATLGGVPPSHVVAMCGSGVTACHLLLAMEQAGLPGARLYPGSWSEWIRDPRRPIAKG